VVPEGLNFQIVTRRLLISSAYPRKTCQIRQEKKPSGISRRSTAFYTTTWFSRILLSFVGVQPVPGCALLSALSGNPSTTYRFSLIHSASFVGSQTRCQSRVGHAVWLTYSNHF
jgi:hypothetical protein